MAMTNQQDPNTVSKQTPKPLGIVETLKQGVSLLFALQNKSGRKRLMDQAESNPMPILFAGVSAMLIFFLVCFITSQLVTKFIV